MKKIIILLVKIILTLSLLFGCLLLFLTLTDYKPDEIISLDINTNDNIISEKGNDFSILTWNIGYGGLGSSEDFFMDDGKGVRASNKETVQSYLNNIINTLENNYTDFAMIQEIDINSKRSYYINELEMLDNLYSNYSSSFAKNYDVSIVPVPWPPLGKVESGLGTFSKFNITSSNRYQFEGNYAWPKNTVMLDRCFIATEIPIENSDKKLILVNAHFSAYDDGSLREKQLGAIKIFINESYEQGNYIVLGADWNQTFDTVDTSKFPMYKEGEYYTPYPIPSDWLNNGWSWGINDNAPTYRLLNAPYEEGVTQVGVIDGFLVSPNVSIKEVEVMDLGFENSDHNPVKMIFHLND